MIGAGRFGLKRGRAVQKSSRSKITVVADLSIELANAAASEFGCRATANWKQAIESADVDVVVVSTPTHVSPHVSLVAAQAGKHVLTEKPCAAFSAEFRKVASVARKADVCIKAGYNHRYHPAVDRAHSLFKEGAIGRSLFARCIYGHGGRAGYESEWRSQAHSGGELLDQGVHALDLFQWFLGEIEEVSSMLSTAYWSISPAEDNVFALLRATDNVVAQLHASWTIWKNTFSFEIFGDKGYLKVCGLGGSYGLERLCCGRRDRPGTVPDEIWQSFDGPDDSLEKEWEAFITAIDEGREPASGGEEACRTLELVEAIRQSALEHRSIRVRLPEPQIRTS